MTSSPQHQPLPVARTAPPAKNVWWAWLAPLLAVALVIGLLWHSLMQKGPAITIAFESGEGIAEGDPVNYRGVRVGVVTSVILGEGLDSVLVRAELEPDAEDLARDGTTFWIVRPEVSLRRVSGLETLLGPRYIAALPGANQSSATPRTDFTGLSRMPSDARLITADAAGSGLDIELITDRAASIAAGSPVLYRDVRVGVVAGIAIAPTGQDVVVAATIFPEYAHLLRTNSRFWNAGGFAVDLGLMEGIKVKADSLESVLSGGLAFATPNNPGELATPGQRYTIEDAPHDDWLDWRPDLMPTP